MRSRTYELRGRRDGREVHYLLCLLAADCAEESLADRQLSFTTLDVRRIWAWHLGVAYATERDQRHEDRGAAPAAHRRRVRKWQGTTTLSLKRDPRLMCLLRCSGEGGGLDGGSLTSVRAYG